MGYAIQTIERAGAKRSTPLIKIESQLIDLVCFAAARPEWRFLMTPVGAGLAGYTNAEMGAVWNDALSDGAPANLIVPLDLYR